MRDMELKAKADEYCQNIIDRQTWVKRKLEIKDEQIGFKPDTQPVRWESERK